MFDYAKLKGRIKEKCGTQSDFADKIGLSNVSISHKLNNKTQWQQDEILKAAQLLEIENEQIPIYFFSERVKNI